MFYTNRLQSIMDTYVVNCDCLKILVGTQMMDSEYYAKVTQKMKVMLAEEQLKYGE